MDYYFWARQAGRWYRIVGVIDRGGFGDVYQCSIVSEFGLLSQSHVAVKVLREVGDTENLRRFWREVSTQRRLRHPNLLSVLDFNLHHDPPYFVMPLMKETLARRLAKMGAVNQVFRAKPALEQVILPLSLAVGYLHSNGIYHRDIKPANIFFDFHGVAKLGDLGICHPNFPLHPTLTWAGIGTRGYTAPETLQRGIASAQSDIYSMGIVFGEMITGRILPLWWWQDQANWPSTQHPRSCHTAVNQLLVNMTHPDPASRYPSVSELVRDIKTVARGYLPSMPAYQPQAPQLASPGLMRLLAMAMSERPRPRG